MTTDPGSYLRRLRLRLAEVADRRELEAILQGRPVPASVGEIRALVAQGGDVNLDVASLVSVAGDVASTELRPRSPSQRSEVDRVAWLLMAEWERVEHRPVGVSYVATFADLARAVIADRTRPADCVARREGTPAGVTPIALIALVMPTDWSDALNVYATAREALEANGDDRSRGTIDAMTRSLEDHAQHLAELAQRGDASPDPDLARAASEMLAVVQTAKIALARLAGASAS